MMHLNPSADLIDGDCRNTIKSEATMSSSATAAIGGRKRHTEIRHGCCHIGRKSMENRTASRSNLITAESSFTINTSTVSTGGNETRQCTVAYNSGGTEQSVIAHETKEQILELTKKDALYDAETKNTAEQWSRPWQTEKPPEIRFDCPKFEDIDNPGCSSEFSYQP
eukprot:11157290-Ditylum_brightwellii.AAC.1